MSNGYSRAGTGNDTALGNSATLLVSFTPAQCPKTFDRASAIFAAFGEVARFDMSMASATGLIVVTFFDVRCAAIAMQAMKPRAKRLPPEAHDFRTVAIATSLFATLPGSFSGFQTFGDIAGVTVEDQDMLIEFYDMRAAQRLSLAVPGSVPQVLMGALPSGLGPELGHFTSLERGDLKATSPGLSHPSPKAGTANPLVPGAVPLGTANPGMLIGSRSGGVVAGSAVPTRDRLEAKDLSKFDIVPEKIRAGEDTRTTVMVRNIPRMRSREDLEHLLKAYGTDNYGFFYMPFDKRRDIHCGFAFIDFAEPLDVLQLYQVLTEWPDWWPAPPNGGAPPAVSYARLQGQEQLMQHFSLSAVMYDSDSRKRPIFYNDSATDEGSNKKVDEEPTNSMESTTGGPSDGSGTSEGRASEEDDLATELLQPSYSSQAVLAPCVGDSEESWYSNFKDAVPAKIYTHHQWGHAAREASSLTGP